MEVVQVTRENSGNPKASGENFLVDNFLWGESQPYQKCPGKIRFSGKSAGDLFGEKEKFSLFSGAKFFVHFSSGSGFLCPFSSGEDSAEALRPGFRVKSNLFLSNPIQLNYYCRSH